jgi:hypothetical protein
MKRAVDCDHGIILGVAWNWPAEPDVPFSVAELIALTKARSADALSAATGRGGTDDPMILKDLLDAAAGRVVRTLHFAGDQGIETSFWIERIGQRYALRLRSQPYRALPDNVVDLGDVRRARRDRRSVGGGPYAA